MTQLINSCEICEHLRMENDGFCSLLEGVLNPRPKATQLHLLRRQSIILSELVLLDRLFHPGLKIAISRLVGLGDHIGWNVKRNPVGKSMAKIAQMFEPFVETP